MQMSLSLSHPIQLNPYLNFHCNFAKENDHSPVIHRLMCVRFPFTLSTHTHYLVSCLPLTPSASLSLFSGGLNPFSCLKHSDSSPTTSGS
ncbi:hypothetical protein RJT34_25797 [Clitoria ternatea]|uniref:Uncharacterized protein n=1 Tax=Clitoria ternatea TaxID=43366 RepID=A0AAN9FQJ4_CLITE